MTCNGIEVMLSAVVSYMPTDHKDCIIVAAKVVKPRLVRTGKKHVVYTLEIV